MYEGGAAIPGLGTDRHSDASMFGLPPHRTCSQRGFLSQPRYGGAPASCVAFGVTCLDLFGPTALSPCYASPNARGLRVGKVPYSRLSWDKLLAPTRRKALHGGSESIGKDKR